MVPILKEENSLEHHGMSITQPKRTARYCLQKLDGTRHEGGRKREREGKGQLGKKETKMEKS